MEQMARSRWRVFSGFTWQLLCFPSFSPSCVSKCWRIRATSSSLRFHRLVVSFPSITRFFLVLWENNSVLFRWQQDGCSGGLWRCSVGWENYRMANFWQGTSIILLLAFSLEKPSPKTESSILAIQARLGLPQFRQILVHWDSEPKKILFLQILS